MLEQANTWGILNFRPEKIIFWASCYTPQRVKTVLLPFFVIEDWNRRNSENWNAHKQGTMSKAAGIWEHPKHQQFPNLAICTSGKWALGLPVGWGDKEEAPRARADHSGTAVGCYATGEEKSGAMQTLLSKALIWELTVPGISLVSWHLLIELHVASWLIKVLNN